MQHGVVLNVRVVADDDAVDVAAQHRAIPDAGVRAERHVADDDGGLGEIDAFAELRFFAEKFIELLCEFVHAGNLPRTGGGTISKKVSHEDRRSGRRKFDFAFATFADASRDLPHFQIGRMRGGW